VVRKKGTKDRDLVRVRGQYGAAVQRHGRDSEEAREALRRLEAEQRRLRLRDAHAVIAAAYAEEQAG
jgi:hypothetical protein